MEKVYVDNKLRKIVTKETEYIELDKQIALLILLLNRKGYHTLFSCSGHDNSRGYITFQYSDKVNDLCHHVLDSRSMHNINRISIRIITIDSNKNTKTISIYPDKANDNWLNVITKIITGYLLVNDDWIKNKIEFTKDYPFEQDFLNHWVSPTNLE